MVFRIALILIMFCSCSVTKSVDKTEAKKLSKEKIVKSSERKGDTIDFIVPNIKYKDTTIVTYNRVGTQLKTSYSSSGSIEAIRCIESTMKEYTETTRELLEESKEKKKKEEVETSSILIYGILAIITIVLFYLIYKIETAIKLIK